MRHYIFLLNVALIVALGTLSCGADKKGEEAAEYDLLTIELTDQQVDLEFPAQIKGASDIRIIPRVDGYIREVKVKEGDIVREGQLLFVIDQVAYRAAVQQAKAGVLQAESRLARVRQEYESKKILLQKNVVSEIDVQQSKRDLDVEVANLAAAQALLESAQNDLSFTELRSPSDGVIGMIPYRQGDFVGPNIENGLTIVSDNREMYVYFSLSESKVMAYISQYSSMREAIDSMPEVSLLLPGGNLYSHKGKVVSVSGIVDERTGAVSVRAVFPNNEGLLLSGSSARVRMERLLEDVIVIPQEATFEVLDKVYVYVVEDSIAKSRIINIERLNDGNSFVVTSGLKAGEVIISKGASLIKEGAKIKQ